MTTHKDTKHRNLTWVALLVSTVTAVGMAAMHHQPVVPDEEWDAQLDRPADAVVTLVADGLPDIQSRDTATFVFGLDETHGLFGGDQTFGSMDKLGVHVDVQSSVPEIFQEAANIGSDKVAREQFLGDEGVQLSDPNRRWLVKIWDIADVDDEERFVVRASVGADSGTTNHGISWNEDETAILYELWKRNADAAPTLVRRSTKWDFPESVNLIPVGVCPVATLPLLFQGSVEFKLLFSKVISCIRHA